MRRSVLLVWISLLMAALACARGEVPITPATPPAAAPVTLAPAPTGTVPPAYPGPDTAASPAAPSPEPPTATARATGYPVNTVAPSPTVELSQPPPQATATTVPTATPLSPTATPPPAPTSAPPATATLAPASTGPRPIPANAQFTQAFGVSHEGGSLIGVPNDMRDGRPETWASLRDGPAAWVLELAASQTVVGLRVYAQRDFRDATTLTKIEVSGDGTNWVAVYVGGGDCGVPQCDTLPQKVFTDLGFEARPARFIRLTGGPTRFAFGEIQVAVQP